MNVMDPFIRNREFIGEIMHAGRQSFVHGDFNLHNLVPVTGGVVDVIALDWQLCGVARVGSEVASIFNTAHETNVIKASVALFNELCTTYAETFNRLNVDEPISVDDVRLAAAATGVFILALLGYYWARPAEGASEAEAFEKVKAHAEQLAAGPMLVYCQVLGELTLLSASDSF
jgi:aminoglycoside phosphotransferase (APT) family kinase protein